MKSNPLESARAKIDRAKYHLQQLDSEIKSARNDQAYGITFHHDRKSDELIIYGLGPRELFIRYAILGGEVVAQARSALEHAVWEMLPNPDLGHRSGFPVFTVKTLAEAKAAQPKPKDRYYDRHGVDMIDGINLAAGAIIEAAQPFGPNYQSSPLYGLNKLWNHDKHRSLNFCAAYLHGIQLSAIHPDRTFDRRIIVGSFNKIVDGAELFRERHPGAGVKVSAEFATSDVIFDGGLFDRKPVVEVLTRLLQFADDIVDGLAKTI